MTYEQFPCDPEVLGTDECALYRKIGKCFMDLHHVYYPRRDYKKPVERDFRNLPENKVIICRDLHNGQHTLPIPEKPSFDEMREAVRKSNYESI